MSLKHIRIFDTTLRDGEQAPGFSMNAEEKMRMALQLEKLGVDTIEAGFAAASPGDFESVREVGRTLKGPMVTSLCRANLADIDATVEALKGSANWGIHIVIASSPLHMKHKLRMEPEEVVRTAKRAVAYAKRFSDNVEFSAEDATRSEPAFLSQLFSETIKEGATVVNVPDTVGYTTPQEMYELISYLMENTPDIHKISVSTHCHDDLGMAVANSLAAVRAGVTQVECTINGIGERAGNASLEEIVMALKTREKLFQCQTMVKTQQLYPTSRMLFKITGMEVQANKAIVGANAFAHESGIHQDGMLKNPLTYEIMTPESVGVSKNQMVLGKHSGRHALSHRIKEMGYEVSQEELEKVFAKFKVLADQKKIVYNQDLEALLFSENQEQEKDCYKLLDMEATSGLKKTPWARVDIDFRGEKLSSEATGDGPVDAALNAVRKGVAPDVVMTFYKVTALTSGTDAQGEVMVQIEDGEKSATGRSIGLDIVSTSVHAFLDALNRLEVRVRKPGNV